MAESTETDMVSKSKLNDALGWKPKPIVNRCVEPARIYKPVICITTWFKNFAFQCGACGKESVVFTFFGAPTCPYCGIKNTPIWEVRP